MPTKDNLAHLSRQTIHRCRDQGSIFVLNRATAGRVVVRGNNGNIFHGFLTVGITFPGISMSPESPGDGSPCDPLKPDCELGDRGSPKLRESFLSQ